MLKRLYPLVFVRFERPDVGHPCGLTADEAKPDGFLGAETAYPWGKLRPTG